MSDRVLVCLCGGFATLAMAAPRIVFAMSARSKFFPEFGKLLGPLGTPANAILPQTGLSLQVLAFGEFDRVLGVIFFSAPLLLADKVSTRCTGG